MTNNDSELIADSFTSGDGRPPAFCLTQDEFLDNPYCLRFSPTEEGKCLQCSNSDIAPENCNKFKNCKRVENNICTDCNDKYVLDENFNCIIE